MANTSFSSPGHQELIELLQDVIRILDSEFTDTTGSGYETLGRCRHLLNGLSREFGTTVMKSYSQVSGG
jgi:hypothetical protein